MTIPKTRQTLLEKLRDRYDDASWEEFQKIYAPYILRVLKAMNMNNHDCQDLQQDIMLISWKSLPQFNYQPEKGSFRAWISTVTRREAIHYIKKRQKAFISTNSEEEQKLQESLRSIDAPDIDNIIKQEWEKFISEKAWENIKNRFSENILMIFKKLSSGVDITSLAQEYELSESSIYVYKKRVLNTLQKEILKLNQELN
jgi:RNA polymerase sigma factor (sigma-70 family)